VKQSFKYRELTIGKPTFKNRQGHRQETANYSMQVPKKLRKLGQPSRIPTRCNTKEKAIAFAQRWLDSAGFKTAVEWEAVPLLEHLGKPNQNGDWDGFGATLINPVWQAEKIGRLKKLFRALNWARLSQLDGAAAKAWFDLQLSRRARDPKRRAGMSRTTVNHYIRSLVHFGNWLESNERVARNPFGRNGKNKAILQTKKATDAERVINRRYLTDEEWQKLSEATEAGPTRHGMSGPDRKVGYWLAIETGLRRNELGSLTRSSFDLTAGTIRLSGRNAKDGMNAVIELGPETCEDLRSWLESKPFGQRLFPFGHKTAKLFRSDLKRAGILARDEHDQQLDFHALRHTTAARLALSGVPIRAAMGHLRHKTIAMTAEVYGRLQRGDVRAAVRSVPRLPLHSSTQSAKTTVEAR